MYDTATQNVGWLIASGFSPSNQAGYDFVAQFSLLSCLRVFHEAGVPFEYEYPDGYPDFENDNNQIGGNSFRIEPVPMIKIHMPDLDNPGEAITDDGKYKFRWHVRYTRWDGDRYSENYPCLDHSEPVEDINQSWCTEAVFDEEAGEFQDPDREWASNEPFFFNLKYSSDNGISWKSLITGNTLYAGIPDPEEPEAIF